MKSTDPATSTVLLKDAGVKRSESRTDVSWQASDALYTPERSWLPRRSLDRFGHTLTSVAHAFLVTGADNCRP